MKSISYEAYLQARGLQSLARQHYDKGLEYQQALEKLVGVEGNVSDSCWAGNVDLDEALRREKIQIEAKLPEAEIAET